MSADRKITAARSVLLLDAPFFGALLLSLKMIPDPTCKTAWVDGRSIGYNPKFVDGLSHDQLVGLLAHETMHPALGHPWRRDGRAMRNWNIACDKAINTTLRDAGFTLPDNAYYAEGDEVGKSAEWIFGRMQEEESNQPQDEQEPGEDDGEQDEQGEDSDGEQDGEGGEGDGDGESDQLGEVRDAPTGTDADGEETPTEQDWKEKVAVAAINAQAQGNLPAGMARMIERALKPRVDVRSLLLRFFSERATGDYSWTRPAVRYIPQGLYLPSLETKELGEVALMIDTSGSMDNVALARARSIVESVIDECNPASVAMYYADAAVQHVDHFAKGEPLIWPGKDTKIGGGGTDFRPALEAIERDETPVCVVCISDLAGTFPEVAPGLPVLWLSTEEDATAPFGETVYIDE
jgi:predicted metal-dependent peptidase